MRSPTLSVCIFTRGPAARIRALLGICRSHVDEIVLAVDRGGHVATLDACADLADRRFLIDSAPMGNVLGWLLHQCSGDWILRLDEDETPSTALLEALPRLVRERFPTNIALSRRWLFPDRSRYLLTHPWQPDYQVRLLRNVPGIWRFPGAMHQALEVTGERRLEDLPIYHADCLLSPLEVRREKAARYERLRTGWASDGFPVNGMYTPEDFEVEAAELGGADEDLVAHVLAGDHGAPGPARTAVTDPPSEDVERFVATRTVPDGAYAGRVAFVREPHTLAAGSSSTFEVTVENLGVESWPALEGPPEIRLGYRWRDTGSDAQVAPEHRQLFTETVPPGRTTRVMLALEAPARPGRYELELDLVHEHVRWFGCAARVPVQVDGASEDGPAPRQIRMHTPYIRAEAIAAASEALGSGWLGQGPRVAEFERAFADYVGAPHCVAVSSGTAALHLALTALDLPAGCEVATTPLTWIATHNAIAYAGCRPLLADVQPHTGAIDPAALERTITPETEAILVVHYGGYPCDLAEIYDMAERRGLPVVEDCAHAAGAGYRGRRIGGAHTLQCFSFNPIKNLTTGHGGAVTTTSPEHADRLRTLRSLGIRRTVDKRMGNGGPYREAYDVAELGFAYELGDVAAAVGLAQLPHLDADNARRAAIAGRYADGLAGVPGLELPRYASDRQSSYHLYPVLVERRADLAARLTQHRVHAGVHYPRNELLGDHAGLPAMERFSSRTLTLPLHPQLADADVDEVIALVRAGW